MNKLISKVDVTYLPKFTKETILDDINLDDLNQGYKFARDNNARAFCTFHFLVPFIEAENYTTTIASVIDFPDGDRSSEEKVFMAGQAYEIGKKASCSEIDVVLCSSHSAAIEDMLSMEIANVPDLMVLKYIIELGIRPEKDIINLLKFFDVEVQKDSVMHCDYIKTNTGRHNNPTFKEKLEQVEWLRNYTNLPLKIAGGIKSWKEIEDYEDKIVGDKIYGVSFDKIKDWK